MDSKGLFTTQGNIMHVSALQLSRSSYTAHDLVVSTDKLTALFTPCSILFDYFVLVLLKQKDVLILLWF